MKNPVLTACKSQHYTFAEIMMVVAIFIIILAMIMTAWMSSGNKVRLNNAARLVSAQLNMARSMAIKERKNIEVVFKGGPDYKMLVKAEDVSENDAPKDNWIALPGGTVFTTTKPGTSTCATILAPCSRPALPSGIRSRICAPNTAMPDR